MKKLKAIGVMVMLSWLLSACASHNVEQYKNEEPKLDLKTYLDGRITGEGMVQDWRGRVATRFSFDACATWQGDTLTLDEHMEYYNGKKDHRIWTLKKVDENNYIGTTPEVIGEAKITVDGNAMNWKYTMDVDVDGSTYRLNFDDWMFLMKNNVLINVNQFSKFGFNVGSLTLFMQKQEGEPCQDQL